jgi:uncharacterized repeat protein (TIGR01451 family)
LKTVDRKFSRAALCAVVSLGLWISVAWALGDEAGSPLAASGGSPPRPCEFPDGTAAAGAPDDLFVCDLRSGDYAVIGNGSGSGGTSLSADGRYEAFESAAPDLVAGDGNGAADIFLKERAAGAVRRISVAPDGTEANGDSSAPALSGHGSFVAFRSAASNLAPGDDNGRADIFIHDPALGRTARIGYALGEPPYGKMGILPAYTDDGAFLAVRRDGLDQLAAWLRDHPAAPETSAAPADSGLQPLAAAPALLAAAAGEADIGVVLEANTDDDSPARVGQNLYYVFWIANAGPSKATNVTVVLKPGSATVVRIPPECSVIGQEVHCAYGTLEADYPPPWGYITVHPTSIGTLTGSASVSATETDPNPDNDSATVTKDIQAALADLAVSVIAPPGPARVGVDLIYSLTVVNKGPSEATNATFTDTLGDVVVKELAPGCSRTADKITCNLGTVPVQNSSQPIAFAIVRPNTAGILVNSATVSTPVTESDTGNNSASINTPVAPASADLQAALSVPAGTVRVGDILVYSFSVTNAGPSAAANPSFTLDLGNVASVGIPQGCAQTGNQVKCSIGPLDAGGTWQRTLGVQPKVAGNLTATAAAIPTTAPAEADPVPANNAVSVTKAIDPASAVLNVTLAAADDTVRVGDWARFGLKVTNSGPSVATNVILSGTVSGPAGELSVPPGCTASGIRSSAPPGPSAWAAAPRTTSTLWLAPPPPER